LSVGLFVKEEGSHEHAHAKQAFGEETVMATVTTLPIEQIGETVVLTPSKNLSELAFEQIERDAIHALQLLDGTRAKNVVLDFCHTDYFGSTALSFFVKLWMRVREVGGAMAFCNLSEHEREILGITRLDTLWTLCDSLEEALQSVTQ
jgi:anti-anti-sigma factor